MEYDTERAKEKNEELVNLAREAILRYWSSAGSNAGPLEALKAATEIVNNFTRVTPPEKEPVILELITMNGRGRARSVKPGNVLLNFRKLLTSLAASGLAVVGAVAVPWTAPLAAIIIWDSVWSNLKVELSEREAAIIWTMWLNRDDDNRVSDAELLDMVNSELRKNGRSSISHQELDDSLKTLKRMQCIERSESDPSKWWLREWVQGDFR